MEGIVLAISHDDVIQKVDIHQFAGPFDALCQFFVDMAGGEVARGMVVADSQDCAGGEDSFFDDNTNVDRCLGDAAT